QPHHHQNNINSNSVNSSSSNNSNHNDNNTHVNFHHITNISKSIKSLENKFDLVNVSNKLVDLKMKMDRSSSQFNEIYTSMSSKLSNNLKQHYHLPSVHQYFHNNIQSMNNKISNNNMSNGYDISQSSQLKGTSDESRIVAHPVGDADDESQRQTVVTASSDPPLLPTGLYHFPVIPNRTHYAKPQFSEHLNCPMVVVVVVVTLSSSSALNILA
ncbi:unnamed protein product, partial [Trichobilharzia regenti]